MGRKRKEQNKNDQHGSNQSGDPIKTSIALHPALDFVALAVGTDIRVLDTRTNVLIPLTQPEDEESSIVRAIAFDPTGTYFASGGDSKHFTIWDSATWSLIKSVRAPKKISSIAFTNDGKNLLAADKFGDVYLTTTSPDTETKENPDILLGHYCSIITSLSVSKDGKYLASTDRDNRIRVSILPDTKYITQGAPEIQSYCFGHTLFVACAAFVKHGDVELLISGGGDGVINLWDPMTGTMLDSYKVESKKADESDTILSLAATSSGEHIVAAVDGRADLLCIALDWEAKTFKKSHESVIFDSVPAPTELVVDHQDRIWIAGGPPSSESKIGFLACATVGAGGKLVAVDNSKWLPKPSAKTLLTANEDGFDKMLAEDFSFIPAFLKRMPKSRNNNWQQEEDDDGDGGEPDSKKSRPNDDEDA